MKTKSLLTAVLAIALSAGTVWADDDQHGNYVTQSVDNIGCFENIISNASFDVEFTQRDVQKVTIYGDPAQLNNVNLTYMGNTLIVGSKENTNVSHVKVIIEAPNLVFSLLPTMSVLPIYVRFTLLSCAGSPYIVTFCTSR